MGILDGYEPRHVMRYFEEITQIPHASGNEAALCAYIRAHAERFGYDCVEDEAGNLLVYVPATAGYGHVPPMLLQAHMDMVPAKREGSSHNFDTDPLKLHIEGHCLYADGTTLGADNAVGLVNMLALMEDSSVTHPPLELLFTVGEEVGMVGIRQVDFSKISARRMLNMDCGDPDVMCVSCAGSAQCVARLPLRRVPVRGTARVLSVEGLEGGHSGVVIDTGRASAIKLLGRALYRLREALELHIADAHCDRVFGITTHARAVLVFHEADLPRAEEVLAELLGELREEFGRTDPNLSLTLSPCAQAPAEMLDAPSGQRLAELLYLLPYGVTKRDCEERDVILCSINAVRLETGGEAECELMLRAPVDSIKWELVRELKLLARLCGGALEVLDSYSGWPYRADSPLQALCHSVYERLNHQILKTEKVNMCAEAGIVCGALPDMDIVGIAPWGRGAHTPEERLDLDTMLPFWTFLTALLEEMCSVA